MTTEVSQKNYSVEEFMALPDDGNLYELVKGELIEMSQPGDRHGRITTKLSRKLGNFVEENKLGEVWTTTGFVIDSTPPKPTVRAPDMAFVIASRVPVISEKAVPVVPDLAVEVISPNDVWSDIEDKIIEYQNSGVRLIWVISPGLKQVFIYQLDKPAAVLGFDNDLDGEQVIPGFKIKVNALFDYGT